MNHTATESPPRTWTVIRLILLTLAMGLVAATAHPARNLLRNGDLSRGAGGRADHWRIEAWVNNPQAFRYRWLPPRGDRGGTLMIRNLKPNDSRWIQSLTLGPGWYRVSAEVRALNVGASKDGANISLMEDGITSATVKGSTGWQRVGFYLKVGKRGADVNVALRLGGFSSLNTGTALFRFPRVVKVDRANPGDGPRYDLALIRRKTASRPAGSPLSLLATGALLVALAFWGWRLYGTESTPSRAMRRRDRRR